MKAVWLPLNAYVHFIWTLVIVALLVILPHLCVLEYDSIKRPKKTKCNSNPFWKFSLDQKQSFFLFILDSTYLDALIKVRVRYFYRVRQCHMNITMFSVWLLRKYSSKYSILCYFYFVGITLFNYNCFSNNVLHIYAAYLTKDE